MRACESMPPRGRPCRAAVLGAVLLALGALQPAVAAVLDDTVRALTLRTASAAGLAGETVVVSANEFFDAAGDRNAPLSERLRDMARSALESNGIRTQVSVAGLAARDAGQEWLLRMVWQRQGETVQLTAMAVLRVRDGAGKVVSRSAELPLAAIDAALLLPDERAMARTLVRRLEAGTRYRHPRTLHFRPVDAAGDDAERTVGRFIEAWLAPALEESSLFALADPATLYAQPTRTIRTRGIRREPVRPAPAAGTGAPANGSGGSLSLAGDLLAADSEIVSDVRASENGLAIEARVNDRFGTAVSSAAMDLPQDLVPAPVLAVLTGPPDAGARTDADGAGGAGATPALSADDGFSHNGLRVELATTRGEGRPRYTEGDLIRFVVRVNEAAYVYLFNLDSEGAATLLFPESGATPIRLQAGEPVILPDDAADYEFRVRAPPGEDTVWVVAAEQQLSFPERLDGDWRHSATVRNRLRAQGEQALGGYAEAALVVITALR